MNIMQRNIQSGLPVSKPRKVLCRSCRQECECAGWTFCSTCRVNTDSETLVILHDHNGGWEIVINRAGNPEWVRSKI